MSQGDGKRALRDHTSAPDSLWCLLGRIEIGLTHAGLRLEGTCEVSARLLEET